MSISTAGAHKIGLIVGSARFPSSSAGTATYVNSPGHPLPLVIETTFPAAQPRDKLPGVYRDANVRQWSSTVLAWDGVVLLCPEYNGGFTAPLKNALDQLFHEWTGKPAALVTLGVKGGTKAQESLRKICGGVLKMDVVEKGLEVELPYATITTLLRGDEALLKGYEGEVKDVLSQLLQKVEEKKKE